MNIESSDKGSYAVVTFAGSLSNEFTEGAHKEIKKYLNLKSKDIIIDMRGVSFLCSAALGLLFSCMNEANDNKTKFVVSGLRDDIRELFVITGVDRHLTIYDSVEEAENNII
ncbi:MAG: STAS domain-containing protein [Spirochaetes bacterium]|nr:STAS domain-containing protein [Spirochaetota bacterium]